jgi:DNA topoisomerase IB
MDEQKPFGIDEIARVQRLALPPKQQPQLQSIHPKDHVRRPMFLRGTSKQISTPADE